MDRHRWGRRLLVALLVVSVSSGRGARSARSVSASAPRHGHDASTLWLSPRMGQAVAQPQPAGRLLALRWALAHRALHGGMSLARLGLLATGGVTWTQQAELTSTAQTANDGFGSAVAVSGDTAVVGANDTPFFSAYGAAYLFRRSGSAWSQQQELTDPGGVTDDWFGYAVAISGTTVVIGAPGATGVVSGTGAAYVYVRTGSTWTLQATLTAADGAAVDGFGQAVAINGDTIVVGAPGKANGAGAAYVFGRSGGVWRQQVEVRYPGDVIGAQFGGAVALNGDTVVVGAPLAPVAYVYVRSGGTWGFQAGLHATHQPGLYFGISVAVWGNTALVGACCDLAGRLAGAVYVFGRSGSVWTLQATIPPPPESLNTDSFGYSVALSRHTAVIGSYGAWIYAGAGSSWSEQAQLVPADRPAYELGYAVAVQGTTAIAGALAAPAAAYAFVRSGASDLDLSASSGTDRLPKPRGRDRERARVGAA